MKLLVILCIEEYAADIAGIVQNAGVEIFSRLDATGFKNNTMQNLADEWFGATEEETYKSTVFFSFTHKENTARVRQLALQFNAALGAFPIKVFVLPAEAVVE